MIRDGNDIPSVPSSVLKIAKTDEFELTDLVEDYVRLDDSVFFGQLQDWKDVYDPVLSDLAGRLLGRNLFKSTDLDQRDVSGLAKTRQLVDEVGAALASAGFDHEYYFAEDEPGQSGYQLVYSAIPLENSENIMIQLENGEVEEASEHLKGIDALKTRTDYLRMYFPAEVRTEVEKIMTRISS